ncbi:hypothetical protein CYCD_01230 [Tenuifilaceae bacterium CYCD]|nr:hypothetical protein CYCD_01230 [Tenuifilaceae bacterium CYCD]
MEIKVTHYVLFILKRVLTIMFLLITVIGFAQETVPVKNIKGAAYISGNISEIQARQMAIDEAKKEALRVAGIDEYIDSHQMLYNSEVNNNLTQSFLSNIQSEIYGAVRYVEIINEIKQIDPETKQFVYQVTINAEVIKYGTRTDPSFNAQIDIDNLRSSYDNGDLMSFSFTPTKDCYLTVFNITDNDASLLFPNVIEKSQIFEHDMQYSFPLAKGRINYRLKVTNDTEETNRLIFVFTKENIPYDNTAGDVVKLTDAEKIFSWIYSIMPDQRKVVYKSFIIRKSI